MAKIDLMTRSFCILTMRLKYCVGRFCPDGYLNSAIEALGEEDSAQQRSEQLIYQKWK